MNTDISKQFEQAAKLCGVSLSSSELSNIELFCKELAVYNQRVNLVSRGDLNSILYNHVLDSLTLLPILTSLCSPPQTLADIGSGAGFPGLILALVCPTLKVTLIEATTKKCKFLQSVTQTLKLDSRVQVVNARAEEIGRVLKYRDSFQFVTARAVGSIELVAELAVPLLKKDGWLLAQKSAAQLSHELEQCKKVLPRIGATLQEVKHVDQEALGTKKVVLVIKKNSPTPDKFPRSYAKIVKRHSK